MLVKKSFQLRITACFFNNMRKRHHFSVGLPRFTFYDLGKRWFSTAAKKKIHRKVGRFYHAKSHNWTASRQKTSERELHTAAGRKNPRRAGHLGFSNARNVDKRWGNLTTKMPVRHPDCISIRHERRRQENEPTCDALDKLDGNHKPNEALSKRNPVGESSCRCLCPGRPWEDSEREIGGADRRGGGPSVCPYAQSPTSTATSA